MPYAEKLNGALACGSATLLPDLDKDERVTRLFHRPESVCGTPTCACVEGRTLMTIS